MWFLRKLPIAWTAKKSNETVLRETDTRSRMNRIRKSKYAVLSIRCVKFLPFGSGVTLILF